MFRNLTIKITDNQLTYQLTKHIIKMISLIYISYYDTERMRTTKL
jgi:hypothetical protein